MLYIVYWAKPSTCLCPRASPEFRSSLRFLCILQINIMHCIPGSYVRICGVLLVYFCLESSTYSAGCRQCNFTNCSVHVCLLRNVPVALLINRSISAYRSE